MRKAVPALMLAEAAAVAGLVESNPQFAAFYQQALNDSGQRATLAQARKASYRVTLGKGIVHYDLHFQSRLGNADASPTVADLLTPVLQCPVESLIHAIWATTSFAELQGLLTELGAIVRYSAGARGDLQGHVIMASHVCMLLQLLASGQRAMSNGESMLDAVTRNLGLRSKARELIETSRSTQPVDDYLTDAGLARTLVQQWRK